MFQKLENSITKIFTNTNFCQDRNASYSLKFSQTKHTYQIEAIVGSKLILQREQIL